MSNKSIEVGSEVIVNDFDHNHDLWNSTVLDMVGNKYSVTKIKDSAYGVVALLDDRRYHPIDTLTLISKSTDGGGKKEEGRKIVFKEPILMRAGDERVLVNGRTLPVDFRIISEDNYQLLLSQSALPGLKEKLKEIRDNSRMTSREYTYIELNKIINSLPDVKED